MCANQTDQQLRSIDLFCGAGGSSCGARDAGVNILAGFDNWNSAVKVFKSNFPSAKVVEQDIRKINANDVKNKIGDVDMILASPECTSHSNAKGAKKGSQDSMNTALEVVRFSEVFKPTWIVIENVEEFGNWERFPEFIRMLNNQGYFVNDEIILNAMHFGVPQSRRRRFILCSLISFPKGPSRTNRKIRQAKLIINSNGYDFTKLRKEGRARSTLAKADEAIKILGEQEEFLIVYYGSGKRGKGGWQRLSEPLRTLTTLDRFAYVVPGRDGHEMRMLQPDELKVAMGFKKSFNLNQVKGLTRRDRVKLMGNAVCPPVMKAIVTSLITQRHGISGE